MPICLRRQVAKTSPKSLTKASQEAYNKKQISCLRQRQTHGNIFTDAGANVQTHVLTSIYDFLVSQFARRLFSLQTREGGLNIKEPIANETSPEYEDRAIAAKINDPRAWMKFDCERRILR